MNDRYNKVLKFAEQKHAGQFRKNLNGQTAKVPYSTHVIKVAELAMATYSVFMINRRWELDVIGAIGLLHDVIEDTNTTTIEVSELLTSAGYNNDEVLIIIKAVLLLSKTDEYEIFNYLFDIRECELSRIVKLCDITHNSSDLGPGNLLDKYKLSKGYLLA